MKTNLTQLLYPLSPPAPCPRDPPRPMRILCLGLPRSGTDSLRTALLTLGLSRVWHGFDLPLYRPRDCALWVPLLRAKLSAEQQHKTTATTEHQLDPATFDWDRLLGDCDAVMDMPPCLFWAELLRFYPDARVIVNRRRDADAWHRSLDGAAQTVLRGWTLWTLSWFDPALFWWFTTAVLWMRAMGQPSGDFTVDGKAWAEKYYDELEKTLKAERREYLEWEVSEGWGPLCAFLGKEAPEEEFPWGNRGGNEFEKNANRAVGRMVQRAVARIGVLVVAVGGIAWAVLRRGYAES
ncbi:hypothetical protein C8R46DRAFT_878133 [Mycena filopes]|nr:hypothetical protein C8R46DRAFT_878133 [Mycena filopes]